MTSQGFALTFIYVMGLESNIINEQIDIYFDMKLNFIIGDQNATFFVTFKSCDYLRKKIAGKM